MKNKNHYEKTKEFHRISAVEKNGYYDAMVGNRPLKHIFPQLRVRNIVRSKLDQLTGYDSGISSLVDVGCGRGDFTIEISKRYPQLKKICGCDFVEQALSIAQKDSASVNNISFQEAQLLSLPYDDNRFDLALCINVLHHIHKEDLGKALSELARISKRYLVLEIKNINNFLYRYLLPKSLLGMNVYPTSIAEVSNALKKHNFQLVEHRGIFLFNWLSPLIILTFKKDKGA